MTQRAFTIDIDPANVDDNNIADDLATGTSWSSSDAEWLSTSHPDGLAHQLVVTTAGNEPAGNGPDLTITGTDADGKTITDTVTLPNATTVETSKYFKTVTSASADAATIDTFDIGFVDEVASKTYPLDNYLPYPPTVQADVTGTINFDIEYTNSDITTNTGQGNFIWVDDGNWTAVTADQTDDLTLPGYRAIRVIVNSYSSGAEIQLYFSFPY